MRRIHVLLAITIVACRDAPTAPSGRQDSVSGEWMAVAVGRDFSCGLTRAGAPYCWGNNYGGGLGTVSTRQNLPVPTALQGAQSFQSISAGYDHICALTAEGTAYCWGSPDYGKLGIGSAAQPLASSQVSAPTAVAGGLTFRSISAGFGHTCALTPNGTAYCWGADVDGALGVGGTGACTPGAQPDSLAQDWARACFRETPIPVAGGITFASISAGYGYTCGAAVDGTAYCWGNNEYGALGDPGTPSNCVLTNQSNCRRFVPAPVAGGLRFASVSAGMFHACGVTVDAKAYCWGMAGPVDPAYDYPTVTSAPLGTGMSGPGGSRVPAAVAGGLRFRAVNARWMRSCGLGTDSHAYCWGSNGFGDLGLGNFDDPVAAPRAVLMPAAADAPAVGWEEDHSCAVTTTGRIFCWGGYNFFGELGSGVVGGTGVDARVSNTPKPIVAPAR